MQFIKNCLLCWNFRNRAEFEPHVIRDDEARFEGTGGNIGYAANEDFVADFQKIRAARLF